MQEKKKISLSMEECQYSPGEYIFRQGDQDDYSIYIIKKGSVNIVHSSESKNNSDLILKNFEKNGYFGEISFITGQQRTLSAKANDFCILYKINRQIFLDIIKDNTHDFENFKMMEDQIKTYRNFSFSDIKCFSCGQVSHISINCPKIHFRISQEIFFLRKNYSKPHLERKKFQRKIRSNFNSRQNVSKCVYAICELLDKNEVQSALDLLEKNLISNYSQSDEDYEELEKSFSQYQSDNYINSQYKINQHDQVLDEHQIKIQNSQKNLNEKKKSKSTMSQITNQTDPKQEFPTSSDEQTSNSSSSHKQESIQHYLSQENQSKMKISTIENKKSPQLQHSPHKRIDFYNDNNSNSNSNKFDIPDLTLSLAQKKRSQDFTNVSNMIIEKLFLSNRDVSIDEIEGKSQNFVQKQNLTPSSSQKQIKQTRQKSVSDRKQNLQDINVRTTSILNENLEEIASNRSINSYNQLERSAQFISHSSNNNNLEKETTLNSQQTKRQISSQFKNQLGSLTNNICNSMIQKLSSLSKDGIASYLLGKKRQVLDKNQVRLSIDKYHQTEKNNLQKQSTSQNITQHLSQEMQKITQLIQNITEQKFDNIMDMIKPNKNSISIDINGHNQKFDDKMLQMNMNLRKDYLDYLLIQTFECFKKYTYFYPHNNFTETIRLLNKFSYEKRWKNQIRIKKTSKIHKFNQQFQKYEVKN